MINFAKKLERFWQNKKKKHHSYKESAQEWVISFDSTLVPCNVSDNNYR
jgi:hypothetical protein